MSRRTIAQAERVMTDGVASYARTTIAHPQRKPYGLFATSGDKPKFITELSGRFGRAFRKARRDGQYYPKAFMAHFTPGGEGFDATPIGERFYIGEQKYLRGQHEARAAVTAPTEVDWDGPVPDEIVDRYYRPNVATPPSIA